MPLTTEHVQALTAKFAADDHEFNRGYTYIKEFAITTRLDEVDPSWQLKPVASYPRGDQAVVIVEMIVHGVSRVGTGMAQILTVTKVNDKGEAVVSEVNEAEKAAATDAMKRAARLFGIGRYLLNFPKNLTDATLLKWLDAPTTHATVPNRDATPHTGVNTQERPATPKNSKIRANDRWTAIIAGIKDMPHFEGQAQHAANAVKLLQKDGHITDDMTADEVIEFIRQEYA